MNPVESLPPALREFLELELALGNAVAETGAGFPAPPIGGWIMLAHPFKNEVPAGLHWRARESSQCSGELTDSARIWFLLAPPGPEPEVPDMDTIRNARKPESKPEPPQGDGFKLEIDHRGEMITYIEPTRSATVICTWWGTPSLLRRSLSGWDYAPDAPAEARSAAMTDAEKDAVFEKILDHLRRHHARNIEVE